MTTSLLNLSDVTSTKVTSFISTTSSMAPNLTVLSEDEKYEILVEYNNEKATLYIPVIAYMLILTVVGTFGNILVCVVYCCKPTKTSSHFFIMALAVLDLLTCVIGMPTEITDLRYPYMFYASAACKLLRFVESVTTMGSSIILISVAVDRYLRICKLGRQISVTAAKRISVAAMVVGVLLSWPACFIFGRSTEKLEPGIYGVDCSTDDSMRNTHYPSLYYGFLGLLFVCCITFFAVVYVQIGLKIWKQKRARVGQRMNRDSGFSSGKQRKFSASSTRDSVGMEQNGNVPEENNKKLEPPIDNASDPISTDMSSDQVNESLSKKKCISDKRISEVSSANSKSNDVLKKRTIKVTRTTVVLFAVTVAYVISYLPFLILMVLRSVKKDFEDSLSPTQEVVFKFCVKSYFINNAINPVIYSYLNLNFRKDAKNMIRRIVGACCCCRRQQQD
ncbi:alpha-2A adrenergic receptor-like [Mya arenaria]|uniref:alpha-2A adrenergic receptor-like n=1 Tax=Mya arenaria TaxID=6604 RepID=UPI0022E76B08|nr:alpha-2A adrenergic receptor-like [Mya arenaria]